VMEYWRDALQEHQRSNTPTLGLFKEEGVP
jgi:hypothetical protein